MYKVNQLDLRFVIQVFPCLQAFSKPINKMVVLLGEKSDDRGSMHNTEDLTQVKYGVILQESIEQGTSPRILELLLWS